ncbi:glycosyltransferase family 4 protein [Paragemmobacter straminiformis]|uniref:Glycosyltransferase family 4 protein n=1 Tax=Paragemmobacter straminiformis TaxID=2045119 RepID=A0A842I6J5_9RHOB|nr:glycosyltransferase family 4 protein [Gemmobacter straminiformis]MBC2835211.1 glycosyltransferase family 4 protein [Gemmobacter straminiformis]
MSQPPALPDGDPATAARRVVVLVQGSSKGLQGVKYGSAFAALRRHLPQVEFWDVDIWGWRRALCMARAFRPDTRIWRETFYSHPATFDAYGKAFAAKVRQQGAPVDCFVTFGLKFDAARHSGGAPVITYTDYTTALTARLANRLRHPLDGALSARRIAQEQRAMEGLAAICVRSRFVADAITGDYGIAPDRIEVVGGGSNLPLPPAAADRNPPDRPVRFLFVGKSFLRKGGDIVLDAFRRLRARQPFAELVMVTADAPPDLPQGVTVHAAPDPALFASLFRSSDAFVIASRFETWGDVLIEAMSQGLPCLCPDQPPLDEIVEEGVTGRLFPPGDSAALARAMEDLCTDAPLRRRLGDAGLARATTRFDWDIVAGKIARTVARTISARDTA